MVYKRKEIVANKNNTNLPLYTKKHRKRRTLTWLYFPLMLTASFTAIGSNNRYENSNVLRQKVDQQSVSKESEKILDKKTDAPSNTPPQSVSKSSQEKTDLTPTSQKHMQNEDSFQKQDNKSSKIKSNDTLPDKKELMRSSSDIKKDDLKKDVPAESHVGGDIKPGSKESTKQTNETTDEQKNETLFFNKKGNKDTTYTAGTFSIKPITVNTGALTFGFHRKNSVINSYAVNTHKSQPGWMGNRPDRPGLGWDMEVGYYPIDNFEFFGSIGFNYEKPMTKVAIGPLYSNDVTQGYPQFRLDFKPKFSFTTSIGLRNYWTIEDSKWDPFLGVTGSLTQEDETSADLSRFQFFGETSQVLGPIRLQGHKTTFAGNIHFGLDYRFTKNAALTLAAAIQYAGRTPTTITRIYNVNFSYRDKRNVWTLPILASFKITL